MYYVINSGKIYDYCIIGVTSAELRRFGYEGNSIYEVLASKDLLFVDEEFEVNCRPTIMVFAKYRGVSDDLNLFVEFKKCFSRNLHELIVDVNFSCLSSYN